MCVCHPLLLRVFPPNNSVVCRGERGLGSLQDPSKRKLITSVYLHLWNFCPSRDSTFPFLFHGSCTIPSLNLFPQLRRVDVCHRHFRELQTCTNHVLKHLQVFGRFNGSHSFPRGTGETANPLSKCVPQCRPTWVHSVIPRKGAQRPFRTAV